MTSLSWTEEITLHQFVSKYKYCLPQLIRTTSGYSDVDSINDISSDEVFWVFGIQKQKRIIAETQDQRFVSIPQTTPLLFRQLSSDTAKPGPPTRLEKLVHGHNYAGIFVKPAADATVVDMDGRGNCCDKLSKLQILDSYNEKYLTVKAVLEGEVNDTPVVIPVYLPITIQVAENLTDDISLLSKLEISTVSAEDFIGLLFEHVLLFDNCPTGDYEYINPSKYGHISFASSNCQTRTTATSSKSSFQSASISDNSDLGDSLDYEDMGSEFFAPSRQQPHPIVAPVEEDVLPPPLPVRSYSASKNKISLMNIGGGGSSSSSSSSYAMPSKPRRLISQPDAGTATDSSWLQRSDRTYVNVTSNTERFSDQSCRREKDKNLSIPRNDLESRKPLQKQTEILHDLIDFETCTNDERSPTMSATDQNIRGVTITRPPRRPRKTKLGSDQQNQTNIALSGHRNQSDVIECNWVDKKASPSQQKTEIDATYTTVQQVSRSALTQNDYRFDSRPSDQRLLKSKLIDSPTEKILPSPTRRAHENVSTNHLSPETSKLVMASPANTTLKPGVQSSLQKTFTDGTRNYRSNDNPVLQPPENVSKYKVDVWNKISDIPLDVENFSIEQLAAAIELLHLPKVATAFREQSVDGHLLMSIVTEEILVNDFHCSIFEAKKLIQFLKNGWRPN